MEKYRPPIESGPMGPAKRPEIYTPKQLAEQNRQIEENKQDARDARAAEVAALKQREAGRIALLQKQAREIIEEDEVRRTEASVEKGRQNIREEMDRLTGVRENTEGKSPDEIQEIKAREQLLAEMKEASLTPDDIAQLPDAKKWVESRTTGDNRIFEMVKKSQGLQKAMEMQEQYIRMTLGERLGGLLTFDLARIQGISIPEMQRQWETDIKNLRRFWNNQKSRRTGERSVSTKEARGILARIKKRKDLIGRYQV